MFHLVTVEAYYRENIEKTDKSGIIIPQHNVACVKAGATVIEGVSRTRDTLISGQLGEYDWEQGYTCHQLGVGAIVVQLAQPYILSKYSLCEIIIKLHRTSRIRTACYTKFISEMHHRYSRH